MKRLLILLVSVVTLSMCAYAFAPMMDSFLDYRLKLFYAYLYCTVFGLISLLVFWRIYCAKKDNISPKLERFTLFMRESPSWAITICGILLSVPLGLFVNISYNYIFGFLTIPIVLILIILFSILLAIDKVRYRLFLNSQFFLKWSFLFLISTVCASILFIILSEARWLFIPKSILFRYNTGEIITIIWSGVPLFLFGTVLSFLLYWIGKGIYAIYRGVKGRLCNVKI